MPKNLKGGKGAKKGKNKPDLESNKNRPMPIKSEDYEDDENIDYAVVTKKLGNGQLLANLAEDGREVIAKLQGTFRSKKFKAQRLRFESGSIILISHNDWDKMWKDRRYLRDDPSQKKEQVQVIHLYSHDQAKRLLRKNEIQRWMLINKDEEEIERKKAEEEENTGFVFGEAEEESNNIVNSEEEVDIDDI
jgi:translation initiation factor IF-1